MMGDKMIRKHRDLAAAAVMFMLAASPSQLAAKGKVKQAAPAPRKVILMDFTRAPLREVPSDRNLVLSDAPSADVERQMASVFTNSSRPS